MKQFGKPILSNAADPLWPEYVAWYADRYERFFAHAAIVAIAVLLTLLVSCGTGSIALEYKPSIPDFRRSTDKVFCIVMCEL